MFKLVYGDGGRFKKILLGAVKPLDAVPIRVAPEGLELRALTPDKNMMIEVVIPSAAFEAIEVESETTLTLSRDHFLRGVRRAGKRDSVTLSYERASRYLRLLLTNIKTGVEREFAVEISEAASELVEPIQIELQVRFQISTDDLGRLIRDVKIVGDELELVYKKGSIEVSSVSEGRSYRTTLALDRPLYQLESREATVSSKYDVDYLKMALTALSAADLVNVEYGSALPLKIYAQLEDGSRVSAWIAPRV